MDPKYKKLMTAARNILELSDQNDTGEYLVDPDNIEDLAEAHREVYEMEE